MVWDEIPWFFQVLNPSDVLFKQSFELIEENDLPSPETPTIEKWRNVSRGAYEEARSRYRRRMSPVAHFDVVMKIVKDQPERVFVN